FTCDRVIIWTRITPLNQGIESIDVNWFVATDTNFNNIVQSGTFQTGPEIDYTVKIDVTGLQPDTYYYYYFNAEGRNSVMGRTKTAILGPIDHLRFAMVHGSNYNNGYFNAFRDLAERNDFEFVFHLGDYIYEYGSGQYGNHPDRWLVPNHDIVTLDDYRARYSHYRLDPDLRYIHQQYPWYAIWDDHEIANDAWVGGAENHDPATQGDFLVRKAAAIQAYFEWMPLRPVNDPSNPNNYIRKTVNWGNLAFLIFLDTRNEARMDPGDLANDSPDKKLLGEAQYQWLTQNLYNSYHEDNIKWRIIANQVMFAPLEIFGWTANKDQWDGYKHERQRLLNFITGWNIKNNVIITGDIHTAWANDIPNPILGNYGNNGQGCANAVEFICTSITSPSTNFGGGIGASAIMWQNNHVKWVELVNRGYSILDINNNRFQCDYYFIDNINSTSYNRYWEKSWYLQDNENFVREAMYPSLSDDILPDLVPETPYQGENNPVSVDDKRNFILLSGFPNPTNGKFFIQFHLDTDSELIFNVYELSGKKVFSKKELFVKCDIQYMNFEFSTLNSGKYILEIANTNYEILAIKHFIKE
ncbi:MAG: alkaline phosphatase D family protein, partial [Bacteroidales bacterium]